ncbi:MAG TPA: type II toxin-antitoxin system HicB family antitoxin [Stellaceae bacterium]|jgi:antitoxin HicB|nr:type II toxin-antitoxin system HicB family antitoxin [Stellaceae bacterium]
MFEHLYAYPARLEAQPDGSYLVQFPDLPEALTDGGDHAEALTQAADCLSETLAGRINRDEEIPPPSLPRRGQELVAPDPTMALKAAIYGALRVRGLTVAELARRLDIDYRQAARLVDPHCASKLTSLKAALDALGYQIAIAVSDKTAA